MKNYDLVEETTKLERSLSITPIQALDLMEDAISEACGYCNIEEPVLGMATSIRDLARIRYNQMGNEGETSRSEGGVSQSFEEGIPKKIRSILNRYRVAKSVRLS